MTSEWTYLTGVVGVLVGARLRFSIGDRKPIVGLLSFAIAIALLLILDLLPKAFEAPVFLLIGVAIGFGVKLLSATGGYLARGNGPEGELD